MVQESSTYRRYYGLLAVTIGLSISLTGCGGGSGSTSPAAITTSTAVGSPNSTTDQTASAADFILGVGTHINGQDIDKNIQTIQQMGLVSVRDDFTWGAVELTKGTFQVPDKLAAYNSKLFSSGISPLMILDYGNPNYDGGGKPVSPEGINAFANYASFAASSLSSSVNYFEIWNEWNSSQAPNSPDSYFSLVKAAAPSIKTANANAVVLAGAVTTSGMRSGWIDQLIQLGVLNYVDGISIHPYVHCDPDSRPETWIDFLNQTAQRLQTENGNKEVPLYITEMGWPSHIGACGNTPETVGKYIARAALLVRTVPSVRGLWWYDLKNDGTDPTNREDNFGMTNYDYSPKPAFNALQDTAQVVRNGRRFVRLPSPPDVILVEIDDAAGNKVFAMWTDNGTTVQDTIAVSQKNGSQLLKLSVGTGSSQGVALQNNQAVMTITDNPQLIFGADTLVITQAN